VKASQKSPEDSKGLYLTKQEVMANAWILLFAGHETSANTLHYTLTFLAIDPKTQSQLQAELDKILGSKPSAEWTYEKDMGLLYNSLVGASMNESLRLTPPVEEIPRAVRGGPQILTLNGKDHIIPDQAFIHISCTATGLNPACWPHSPSKVSGKSHDMEEWKPHRWLSSSKTTTPKSNEYNSAAAGTADAESIDGPIEAYFDNSKGALLTPVKGAFVPFSEGPRACPGRRFAQVEITAVLAALCKEYSVELDVGRWATDAEVERMSKEERRTIYDKARERAKSVVKGSVSIIALKMMENIPMRFVRRGEERFRDCYI